MRNIMVGLLFLGIMQTTFATPRSNTQDQVQTLYKQITNDLMSMRKEFSGAQPKVYALLDQVDRINNLTKTIYQKKQTLESQINNTNSSAKNLLAENKDLKTEVTALKQKLDTASKFIDNTNKQLDAEIKRAEKRSKEKKDLLGKITQIENEKNLKSLDDKLKDKVNKSVEAEVAAQLKNLAEDQSLNLTSTSAPNSPR